MATDRFVVGLVGAPFGLKGFVKVRPPSGEIDHLLKLSRVTLRQDGTEKIMDIEASSPALPQVVIKFAGIDSPEAAKTLGGAELIVRREQASPLKPGEYYVEDLRGLAVVAADAAETGSGAAGAGQKGFSGQNSEILGYITDIVEGGGGDLAEIRLSTGEFRFVPFRNEFFAPLDLTSGRIILLKRWILE
ncbi:MAG: ribosome maturation factor RimM [Treponema sp.]|jgi:16S rRNA processing protein RimM|nr:ribosome maturation factor RimM [Treponema sp.]